MDGVDGALATAAVALVIAAAAVLAAGRRQASRRGWPWWMAALLGTAAGCALAILDRSADAAPLMAARGLLLAWPVLVLTALRRFHARQGLPTGPRADMAVLLVGLAASPWLPAPATFGLHLYVATLAWSARTDDGAGLLRLVGLLVALAAVPAALAPWTGAGGPIKVHALAAAGAMMVAGYAALSAMAARTERELRQSRRRFRVLAHTDPLTGVSNRRHFDDSAERLRRSDATRPPVLLLLDVDHFKLINDQLGHPAGDRALRLVGRCVQEALREGDLAARLGGDEFALVLPGATLPQAMAVAERIVERLQQQSPEHRLPVLSVSFGMVLMQAAESLSDALNRADRALYEAKRQGRSRAVAAQGDDDEPEFTESQRLGLTAY